MRKIVVFLFTLIGLLLIVNAAAREQKQKEPCEEARTQFESNQCAHKQFLAADGELNKVYNKLMSTLDNAEERAKLKDAELAWLKYRDANCEYEAFFYRGGTIRPMIQSLCLTRVTGARAAELKKQLVLLER